MFQYNFIQVITHSTPSSIFANLQNALFPRVPVIEYGLYFYLAFLCAAVLLVLRDKRSFFALFWFAFSVAFLEFGPMDIISLHPLSLHYMLAYRLGRFMLVAAVPIAAVIAMGLGKLLAFKDRRLLAVGAIILFLVLAVLYLQNYQIENYWYYWQMYPESLALQPANFIRNTAPNSTVYLEDLVPNAGDIGYLTAFWVYMGSVNAYYSVQSVSNTINCSAITHGSYIVWAGKPACSNWKDVFNVSVPSSIPESMVASESVNMKWIITNVYYAS